MDALQPITAAIWRTIRFSRIRSPEITIRSSANKWLQNDINATFSGTRNLSLNSQPLIGMSHLHFDLHFENGMTSGTTSLMYHWKRYVILI